MYIVMDIGGTNARIAFSKDGKNLFHLERFELLHQFDKDLEKIFNLIDKQVSGKRIGAIGVAIAGNLDEKEGRIIESKNLNEWVGMDISTIFREKYECIVKVENDAVLTAYSEINNKDLKDGKYIFLTWGTGMGGVSFNKNKKTYILQKLNPKTYLKEFDLECGGKSIHRKFGKLPTELNDEEWQDVTNKFETNIIKICKAYGVDNFILTGGVFEKQKNKLSEVVEKLKEKSIFLIPSRFGEYAGIHGTLNFINTKHSTSMFKR